MARKVFVDRDECIGCGLCAEIAPDVFRLNEEGISEVLASYVGPQDTIQEAIDECPVECIHWEGE